MRKIMTIALAMLALAIFAPTALQANEINVTIDSVAVDFEGQPPTIVDGRTLVPVRDVFEAMGLYVSWNQTEQTATIMHYSGFEINITIGSDTFIADSVQLPLDVPARIINGRTMLPIRAVVESIGYYVGWNQYTSTINIVTYITVQDMQLSTRLTSLSLNDSDLQNDDIAPLVYMRNLNDLCLSWTRISDITPLAGLTNLTALGLHGTEVRDLRPLARLVNLTELRISGQGRVYDITPLAGLTNLTVLVILDGQFRDMSPLRRMTGLTELIVQTSAVSDITPLAGLTNLTSLELSHSPVSDITPLAGLVNLERAGLNDNHIRDWSPVEHVEEVLGRP